MTSAKVPRRRAPRGVRKDKRIQVSLMPDDLQAFHARAKAEGLTFSNLGRLLIVQAMSADQLQSKHPTAQRHATSIAED